MSHQRRNDTATAPCDDGLASARQALLVGLFTLAGAVWLAGPGCSAQSGDPSPEETSADAAGTAAPATTSPSARAPREDFEPDPPGQWLALDLHVHAWGASNDAGPDSTPARIAEVARERGLFAVVLQDHSNSTGSDPFTLEEDPALYNQGPEFVHWDEAARLSVPGEFLLVSGNELSPRDEGNDPVGHIGCIPRTLGSFDTDSPFVDRPRGSVTGGEALAQALDRGCFAIVNHPYAVAAWIAYDWSSFAYDALEIWNGMLTTLDLQGRDAWRCDLLAGRQVTPVAASDNHRIEDPPPGTLFDPALGWPSTAVFSAEPSWEGVITALESGYVTLFEGESRLFLDGYDEGRWRAEGAETRFLRVRGHLDAESRRPAELRVTRAFACDDPRPDVAPPPTVSEEVLLEQTIAQGEDFDIALPIAGEPGVYSATLLSRRPSPIDGPRHAAMSRGLVIAAER
ncbi:MAG: hypothetical protein EA398_01910 [Deltaproteobacteria bacterium]|nr:MAG: hypothetical protein EA398_01910 [Deltaproteobacteria bacterium]